MRIHITKELSKYRHAPGQPVTRHCLVAAALTMQLPLPEEYYWSVGQLQARIKDQNDSTVECIDLPPSVRKIIRNYDDQKPTKAVFFQI